MPQQNQPSPSEATKQTQDRKPKPAPKSELLLDVALEAQYFRNSGIGLPMVLIPNHPTCKTPMPLLDNYDFACWLTWRCYKKHGFIATTALINATIRYLTGLAMYDESIAVLDAETRQIIAPKAHGTKEATRLQPAHSMSTPIPQVSPLLIARNVGHQLNATSQA